MSKKRNRHGQAGPPAKKQHKSHSTKLRNPHVHVPKTPLAPANNPQTKKPASKNPNQAQNQPTIPFNAGDRILLVGEGDFSFALSLVKHHRKRVASLCATCFDSRVDLVEKYGQAPGYIDEILDQDDQAKGGDVDEDDAANDDGSAYNTDDEIIDEEEEGQQNNDGDANTTDTTAPIQTKVLYSIDATKLHTYKPLKKDKQGFTRIVFNFPHVGGKSTDVNRQVRYNQALLHDFFVSAKELLTKDMDKAKEYDGEKTGANDVPVGERRKKGKRGAGKDGLKEEKKVDATVLVTLFEGTPYTLWNIKDLARSAGLKVLRSWAFKSEVYPGYEHARTLGNIRSKEDAVGMEGDDVAQEEDESSEKADEVEGTEKADGHEKGNNDDWSGFDDDEEGDEDDDETENGTASATKDGTSSNPSSKRPGRWRGEERAARTYEFGLAEVEKQKSSNVKKPIVEDDEDEFERFKKKRKRKGGKLFDEDASSEGEK